jgi:hypothetical protein
MRRSKPRVRAIRPDDPEQLSTEELLTLHERLCAPLDPAARTRIVDAAARRGWDGGWSMDGLAA